MMDHVEISKLGSIRIDVVTEAGLVFRSLADWELDFQEGFRV
jgi:hypothetical protein